MKYQTIKTEITDSFFKIILSRPDVKNAINSKMMDELIDSIEDAANSKAKVLVITAEGDTFCSGADLNWLKEAIDWDFNQNYQDSYKLTLLLEKIQSFPKPVICLVNGSAVGGGVGIMLSSDIIIANSNSSFGLSEVRIGIVPVAIIHLVIDRIGTTRAKELMLTGKRISSDYAKEIGLINYCMPKEKMETILDDVLKQLTQNAPNAMKKVKEMINNISLIKSDKGKEYMAKTIAELRLSDEGQRGIRGFLDKELIKW